MVHIELRTEVSAPIEVVFDLARSIDAHLDSMHGSGEQAIGGVTSGLIELGEHVTWKARHFGVHFTMTSEIVAMERPSFFVDEQRRGPFRRFRHEHRFESVGGVTVMHDRIEFTSPVGPIGAIVDRLVLTRYLTRIITERNEFLRTAAEGSI